MSMEQTARNFFEACEGGKGWKTCRAFCHDDATFSCQAPTLDDIQTLEDYTEWTKGILGPIPDGHPELMAFATDAGRPRVVAVATFHGTQTGEGGPVAPTGRPVATDYVYVMDFEDEKIRHMTKIWNDQVALRQLGWAEPATEPTPT
ncbi:ester cyclase [Salipiger mucosus]|uniref:SnoaL-like domain-containing protein n=1 Tax=Salipiger mucosus DSM 16094 TaxID=1123237 RepID=S9QWM5_9RHOB|nr:ester cyclase [Salipiger mucosus]EPX83987.1 hypothetical protein Salmuc_01762 [Salipiger mucosus DSM 16094]